MRVPAEEVADHVLDIAQLLCPGEVTTYGDIAWLAGVSARQTGAVMSHYGSATTWWRVVNSRGELPVHLLTEARGRWLAEGITVKTNGTVDLRVHRLSKVRLQERLNAKTNPGTAG